MIPNFCKACGARVEGRAGYCGASECQNFERDRLLLATPGIEKMTKDSLLSWIEEFAQSHRSSESPDFVAFYKRVKKHPWEDVSGLHTEWIQLRIRHLTVDEKKREAMLCGANAIYGKMGSDVISWDHVKGADKLAREMTIPSFGDSPANSGSFARKIFERLGGYGVDPGFDVQDPDGIAEMFKRDLLRTSLAREVKGKRLYVTSLFVTKPKNGDEAKLELKADVSDPDAFESGICGKNVVILPHDETVDYVAIPKPSPEKEIDRAIENKAVRKRHLDIAQGTELDKIATYFEMARQILGERCILEPDVALRERLRPKLPLEPGSQFRNRSQIAGSYSNGVYHDVGAVSNGVAGCFDASHGAHLDLVAKINGIVRKQNEDDNGLRARLYKLL